MRDLTEYTRLIKNGDIEKSLCFKALHAPKYLYKYVSLFDENDVGELYHKRNKQKLDTLENNSLWFSTYSQLNDPYEFKGFYFDRSVLGVDDSIMRSFNYIMESYRQRKLICSFSASSSNNMPMWAHYANNHKGFCIKYLLLSAPLPFNLYPVIYLEHRLRISDLEMAQDYISLYKYKENPDYDSIRQLDYRYTLLAMLKQSFWQYENEYRIVVENAGNQNIPLGEIPFAALEVECVYTGINCSTANIKNIQRIARLNGYEHKLMRFDNLSSDFELRSEP